MTITYGWVSIHGLLGAQTASWCSLPLLWGVDIQRGENVLTSFKYIYIFSQRTVVTAAHCCRANNIAKVTVRCRLSLQPNVHFHFLQYYKSDSGTLASPSNNVWSSDYVDRSNHDLIKVRVGSLHRQPGTDDTEQVSSFFIADVFLISLSQLQEVAAAHFNVHEHYDDRTLENDICVVILAAPLRSNQSKMFPIFSFFK